MRYQVDLIDEVVLLIDRDCQVRDAFRAQGQTVHDSAFPAMYYTYRSLLTQVGMCAVCGRDVDQVNEPCSSSGGFHAFAGVDDDPSIADLHKAPARSIALKTLHYDDLAFFVEADNLFSIEEIAVPMSE